MSNIIYNLEKNIQVKYFNIPFQIIMEVIVDQLQQEKYVKENDIIQDLLNSVNLFCQFFHQQYQIKLKEQEQLHTLNKFRNDIREHVEDNIKQILHIVTQQEF